MTRTLILTAVLVLGRPVYWASDWTAALACLVIGAAFTFYVARTTWRLIPC